MSTQPLTGPSELGQSIRRARKAQGLTLVDAAGLCGVSVRFLSELENGRASCGVGRIFTVAHSLGLDLQLSSRDPGLFHE